MMISAFGISCGYFRVVGLMHLDKYIANSNILYVVTFTGTFIGAVIFSHACKFYILKKIKWIQ